MGYNKIRKRSVRNQDIWNTIRISIRMRFGCESVGNDASQARNWRAASSEFVEQLEVIWRERLVRVERAEHLHVRVGVCVQ